MPENRAVDNSGLPNFYEKNIAVLRGKAPQFAYLVETRLNNLTVETIPFELSREGTAVSTVPGPEGKPLRMHSKYEPAKEAEKFVAGQGELENLVVCFGLGNGYHVRELLKKLPEDGRLLVVSVNEELALLNMKYVDLSDVFADGRMQLMIDSDADRLAEFYYGVLDWKKLSGVSLVAHGPSRQLYPETYNLFLEKVRYLTRQSHGNLLTIMKNGAEFQENTLKNLKNFVLRPGVKHLFDILKGEHPAILVSAGPSLDKNVHLLKEVKGRVFIIATDTALKPLLAHDIEPDIVVAADPCYLNSLDFQGLPPVSTVLVVEPMASPDIFRWHKGPQVVCSFGDVVVKWLESFSEVKGQLFAWGSISTTAFDLARKIGADPIIFIGQDLSFPFGKTHCRGTFHDERYQWQSDYWNTFEMKFTWFSARGKRKLTDINGREVLTDEQMNIYRQWFENQIERTKAKLVNATEGGVLKKGYELLSFREAVDRYCQKAFPVAETLKKVLGQTVPINLEGFHRELTALRKMMATVRDGANETLDSIKKFTTYKSDQNFPPLRGKDLELFKKIIEFYDNFRKMPCLALWFQNTYQKDLHRFAAKMPKTDLPPEEVRVGNFTEAYRGAMESALHFVNWLEPIVQENHSFITESLEQYRQHLAQQRREPGKAG